MIRSIFKAPKFLSKSTIQAQTRFLSVSQYSFQTPKTTVIDDDFDPEKLKKQVLEMQEKIKAEQESTNLDEKAKEEILKQEADFKSKIEFTSEAKSGKFQTETAKLLNIVAESLYSDSQVFIREFVANASDAIEKARLGANMDGDYLIKINTNKTDNTITFEDNGIGMNEAEVEELLGTIAKSGSQKFKQMAEAGNDKSIIGQFGVGFYSSFMVGDKVEVYTRKHGEDDGVYWESDGMESYSTRIVKNVEQGTKIIITLKPKHREYADSTRVFEILDKFSSFSRHQISLDGGLVDMKSPVWNLLPSEMDDAMYNDFYKFIDSTDENPRWHLNYRVESPLSIKSIFYVPVGRPSMYEVQKEDNETSGKSKVSLYSRNVLIQKNSVLLPAWLRFVKGVVDCEDIPLNLSRELLQDEALIKRLQKQLTSRIIKWFTQKAKRNDKAYQEFFNDYKIYIIQGMLDPDMASEKDNMFKLLRYETSFLPKGETTSLQDYKAKTKENGVNQTEIVYLYANNRHQAESSSYYEILKSKGYEVLFCYDTYDDLAMANLNNFDGAPIQSAESVIDSKFSNETSSDNNIGDYEQVEKLCSWACNEMAGKCQTVEVNKQLNKQPAMINSQNLSLLRYMFRQQKMAQATNDQDMDETYKNLLKLQVNPVHPLVKFAADEYENNPEKSKKVLKHLMNWSLSSAGLFDDSKALLDDTNELLLEMIDGKYIKSEEPVESEAGSARGVNDL